MSGLSGTSGSNGYGYLASGRAILGNYITVEEDEPGCMVVPFNDIDYIFNIPSTKKIDFKGDNQKNWFKLQEGYYEIGSTININDVLNYLVLKIQISEDEGDTFYDYLVKCYQGGLYKSYDIDTIIEASDQIYVRISIMWNNSIDKIMSDSSYLSSQIFGDKPPCDLDGILSDFWVHQISDYIAQ